eukprot:CAMPEP_0198310772 /NCGR_PEP_ID=MMETSP1450-20131203/2715_1 /TAXON_ID=753684 ORGANISM="Madagascaria erythrocladiodes, Strain CCMP3234" /NCGR_SAMPLE_ID=MMETSP1450 /ASSEMBLY_ACC=CAM_ASM_001115 /LENGTH=857 /DNA_ID=CAMNT_0044013619 /DNA_START=60 /DNA_END=2633 /DNA_ORIENTATION=-
MACAGIDLGNRNCVVAVVQRGGIDICTNEVSNRATPHMVSFQGEQRHVGEAAANFAMQNFKNTCTDLLRLVGRRMDDPIVQKELPRLKYAVAARPDDNGTAATVMYGSPGEEGDGTQTFSIEALLAMMLANLGRLAAGTDGVAGTSLVVSVPGFFDDMQRRAILNAARIANVKVLRLLDDHVAIALSYGIFRTADLPEADAQKVAIVDIGQSSTTVCIGAFKKTEANVLGVAFDESLGGRTIDDMLLEYFSREFKEKYKIDPLSKPRPTLRLRAECEKLKKVLSANSEAPMNIECLMDDVDVRAFLKRPDLEEIIRPLADRLTGVCRQALANAKITAADLHSVEVVGGSTRVPLFKRVIEEVLGKTPRTTLNADECVARGCAMMSAILSPSFKVREYGLTSVCPYEVSVFKEFANGAGSETVKILPRSHVAPATKALSFANQGPFSLTTKYSGDGVERSIADFHVDVPGSEQYPDAKVRVKIRMNWDGIVEPYSAQLIYEVEEEEVVEPPKPEPASPISEPSETGASPAKDSEKPDAPMEGADETAAGAPPSANADMSDAGDKPEEAKPTVRIVKKTKSIDLPISRGSVGLCLSEVAVQSATEMESKMRATDLYLKEKADARNALESYIYDMRSRLDEYGGDLKEFCEESARVAFKTQLDAMEEWLYEDEGENASKSVFVSKRGDLEKIGAPIVFRKVEADNREKHLRELQQLCVEFKQVTENQTRFEHLTQEEKNTVASKCDEVDAWMASEVEKQNQLPKSADPSLTGAVVAVKKGELTAVCSPIYNKPKPKPKEPEKPPPTTADKDVMNDQAGAPPKTGNDVEMKDKDNGNGEAAETPAGDGQKAEADQAMEVEK